MNKKLRKKTVKCHSYAIRLDFSLTNFLIKNLYLKKFGLGLIVYFII